MTRDSVKYKGSEDEWNGYLSPALSFAPLITVQHSGGANRSSVIAAITSVDRPVDGTDCQGGMELVGILVCSLVFVVAVPGLYIYSRNDGPLQIENLVSLLFDERLRSGRVPCQNFPRDTTTLRHVTETSNRIPGLQFNTLYICIFICQGKEMGSQVG